MVTVYISHSNAPDDTEFSQILGSQLAGRGFHVVSDADSAGLSVENHFTLPHALISADVVVLLISNNFESSPSLIFESGAAKSFAKESGGLLFLPIIIDQRSVPSQFNDIVALFIPDRNIAKLIGEIERTIASFVARRLVRKERQEFFAQKIERKSAEFIDDAVQAQRAAEQRNRWAGVAWYLLGFLGLVGGLVFAFLSAGTVSAQPDQRWDLLAETLLKTIVMVGFLAACARYAFSLGKSYTSESLKCADRIHAIAFGKFYLQAYGEQATWGELKEVFQHWNIDRASTFSTLDVSDVDPHILKLFSTVVAAVRGDAKK